MGRAEAANKVSVTWSLVIFTMQDSRSQAARIRAAMESSLEQQRASVRRQLEAVHSVIEAPQAQAACEPIAQPDPARMIDDAARKHGVDPALVREVARQESGFRPCVVSPKGAEGLMQLMPATRSEEHTSELQSRFGISYAVFCL